MAQERGSWLNYKGAARNERRDNQKRWGCSLRQQGPGFGVFAVEVEARSALLSCTLPRNEC